jgi:hypothetical protein
VARLSILYLGSEDIQKKKKKKVITKTKTDVAQGIFEIVDGG